MTLLWSVVCRCTLLHRQVRTCCTYFRRTSHVLLTYKYTQWLGEVGFCPNTVFVSLTAVTWPNMRLNIVFIMCLWRSCSLTCSFSCSLVLAQSYVLGYPRFTACQLDEYFSFFYTKVKFSFNVFSSYSKLFFNLLISCLWSIKIQGRSVLMAVYWFKYNFLQ